MTEPTIYDKLLARKRTWTPVAMTAGKLFPGAEELLQRALCARHLELPVGEFITAACRGDIPEAAREVLMSNVTDEIKHDTALGFAAAAHPIPAHIEAEAGHFVTAAIENPDHTVVKAMTLERSVFFVLLPMMRFLGDAGLRTVASDISRDEQVHVASHSFVCRELGLTYSPSLDRLRRDLVEWITQPLDPENENRYLSRNFWLEQSDSLLYTGKAPGLTETKRARMPAFFEHSNNNLPQYA